MKAIKLSALLLVAVMILSALPFAVSAETITATVDLSNVRKNERGPGYNWDNINDVLTLSGLDINTEDDYGFRLPDGATVVLVGNNKIKAKKAALVAHGTATIKGNGSITLEGECGVLNVSSNQIQKLTFVSGNYTINATVDGMRSEYIPLTLSGGNYTINVTGDGDALSSLKLKVFGASVTANAPLYSQNMLEVRACTLGITAKTAALRSDHSINIDQLNITNENGVEISEYNGQTAIRAESTYERVRTSILFGESVPAFVDYLIFLAIILVLASVIGLPILRQRKKDEALRRAYDEAHPKKVKPTKKK